MTPERPLDMYVHDPRTEPRFPRLATVEEQKKAHPKCLACRHRIPEYDELGDWCDWLNTSIHADFYCRDWCAMIITKKGTP